MRLSFAPASSATENWYFRNDSNIHDSPIKGASFHWMTEVLVDHAGFQPALRRCKRCVLALTLTAHESKLFKTSQLYRMLFWAGHRPGLGKTLSGAESIPRAPLRLRSRFFYDTVPNLASRECTNNVWSRRPVVTGLAHATRRRVSKIGREGEIQTRAVRLEGPPSLSLDHFPTK